MENKHISSLQSDNKNARKRTDRSFSMLQDSLLEVGAARSIVIDESDTILAGNGTVEAAKKIGIEKVQVIDVDGATIVAVRRKNLTEEQKRRLSLYDNRTAELAEWESEVLAELNEEIDLSRLWTEEEWAELVPEQPAISEEEDEENTAALLDQAEQGKIESRVQPGEIWALGRHRIACADSTDESIVRALLGDLSEISARGRTPDFVWADPPYGINVVKKNGRIGSSQAENDRRQSSKAGGVRAPKQVATYAPVIGDNSSETAAASIALCELVFPKSKKIIWGANHYGLLPKSSCWIVWDKKNGETSFADAELAWTNLPGAVRIFRHMWNGMLRDSENNGQKRCHPNQKPIALCEWAFEKYGESNDLIFDPFLGSAPSLIAAQKMEGTRTVYGFELSPEYCEVICRRWEQFTGQPAEKVGSLT